MHRNYLVSALIFIISITSAFGQKNDVISSSYKYHVTFINNGNTLVDDICQLDVAKSQSYFYSLGAEEQKKKLADAFSKGQQNGTTAKLSSKDFKRNFYRYSTIKNYRAKQIIVSERVGVQQLAVVKDTLSAKGWVISKDKKIINNVTCYKAQLENGGVTTTAWFSTTIPVQEGPFYYYGLPGLIVSLKSSQGWEAQLLNLNYNNDQNVVIKIPRYTLVSDKQLDKAKKNAKALAEQGIFSNGDRIEKVNN